MIAMAISCSPKLLIADEPTTAFGCHDSSANIRLIKRIAKGNANGNYDDYT